ncbi:hypothetical protein OAA62_00340 [bacterium]|nr:hypothetical protein [bacterium]
MNVRELQLKNVQQEKRIANLYTLIDTLQVNLRTAVHYLNEDDKTKVTSVQSYKWCMDWKIGDEKPD